MKANIIYPHYVKEKLHPPIKFPLKSWRNVKISKDTFEWFIQNDHSLKIKIEVLNGQFKGVWSCRVVS